MKYRHDEVLDLLDAANCCEDIQVIIATIHEYPVMFPNGFYTKYRGLLLVYADLFIKEL